MTQAPADQLRIWREKPYAMVEDLFGVKPDAWQLKALEAFPHCPRLAMRACTGPGKTALLAWIGWNFLLTRPHPYIGATSITGDNLRANLWTELSRWRERSPLLKSAFTQLKTAIYANGHEATWKLEARTWAKDANPEQIGNTLAGVHADYVMWLLDETGDYPDAVMPACEAIFSGDPNEAHIVQAGNPTRRGGPLFKAVMDKSGLWRVITITADPDDPDRTPRVSVEHARNMISQYGRDNPWVKVKIFGEFPDSDFNALIGHDEVMESMGRVYREHDISGRAKILGVDVALYGDDASVIVRRQGTQVFTPKKYRNINGVQGAGQVAREFSDWGAQAVFIDNTGGFGSSWVDQLHVQGFSPIAVHFSAQAHQPHLYFNKRAEMYFDAVEWIKRGGALPHSPEILNALTQTTYTTRGDKLILEPKADVKEKLGYSPDEADAFCFVAGTLVSTPNGDIPIENVKDGDVVFTPLGEASVAKRWETNTTKLTTAIFSNGSYLVGRPEHKIFTYCSGLVPIDALSFTMAISPLKEREKWLSASASFTAIRSIGFKIAVDTFPRAFRFTAKGCCIAVYGLSIMARFQMGMRCIIKTAIGAITPLKTLNFLVSLSMPQNILTSEVVFQKSKSANVGFSNSRKKKLKSGILPLPGWLGIVRTVLKLGKSGRDQNANASAAEISSGLFSHRKPNFVRRLAHNPSQSGAILQLRALVIGAAKRFLQTGIAKQRVVPVSVRTENVPPTLVYNLTLDRDNAYYANGVLVFNCLTFAEPVANASKPRPIHRHIEHYDPFAEIHRALADDYNPFRN